MIETPHDHRARLLALMVASWDDLRDRISPFRARPTAPSSELGGSENDPSWRVQDVVGHLAVWERMAARSLAGIPLPDGEEIAAQEPWDMDRFNDAMIARWSSRPYAQTLADLDAAHATLVAVVSAADDADCVPGGRAWEQIRDDGAGHYPAHTAVGDRFADADGDGKSG